MSNSICVLDGCDLQVKAKGLCNGHYQQKSKGKEFTPVRLGVRGGNSLAERFWARVPKTTSEECWGWLGSLDAGGYGRITVDGKYLRAHRISYKLNLGEIPRGLVVDHKCHNKACVNPYHLQAVPQKQNAENRSGPTRRSKTGVRGVRWCKRSHRYIASVGHNGRYYYVGKFKDLGEADRAVTAKRLELFTNNLNDRKPI